ncbi:MAG: sigma-54-dependent Fis family transcriptional regulator [Betaproteobacteria bacterium]|nr:sigma-54-dependent Fis family transcriptional regulator [Betaproteobacteria bacterium]
MTPALPTVLVVDDEIRSQEALRRTLEEDFTVFTASSAAEARAIMGREAIQVVLTDQRMPEVSGVTFLKEVRETWPDTVRIIISGYTDSEDIIAGINEAGIYQYLLKPWHPDQLLLTLRRAAELHRLQQENCQLAVELRAAEPVLRRHVEGVRARVKQAFDLNNLVRAPHSPMHALCDQVARAARYDVSMLLMGESGTGKELLARAIHYASGRADQAFVVENCGALPDTLLESELFGHKKGAFTGASEDRIGLFQQAHGGTLFLDEIGETTPAFQVKLLRVLQEGEFRPVGGARPQRVDVRVIAATNRDLETEVKAGRFREDLYYRLATVPVRVPPLRDRPMDIPLIAQAILRKAAQALGRGEVRGFGDELAACLAAYPWPGNVRELQNEIQRLLVLSEGATLDVGLLGPHIRHAGLVRVLGEGDPARGALRNQVDALEARLVQETLVRHDGNLSRAAKELGLSRLGLRQKLTRLGLEPPLRPRGRPVSPLSPAGGATVKSPKGAREVEP